MDITFAKLLCCCFFILVVNGASSLTKNNKILVKNGERSSKIRRYLLDQQQSIHYSSDLQRIACATTCIETYRNMTLNCCQTGDNMICYDLDKYMDELKTYVNLCSGQSSTAQSGVHSGGTLTTQPGIKPCQSSTAQQGLYSGGTLTTQPGIQPGQSSTAQPGLYSGGTLTTQPGIQPGQSSTAQPGLHSGGTLITQPGLLHGRSPTAQPGLYPGQTHSGFPGLQSTTCGVITKWSTWINRHTPEIITDEVESMTTAEKSAFCGSGKLIGVECETITKIPYFSAGDIGTTCNIDTGIVCIAYENFPVGCQNYMIRYQCQEEVCGQTTAFSTVGTVQGQQSTATPVGHLNEASTATPSASPITVCATTTRWSAWLNRDKPSTGDGDKEEMTAEEVRQFCGNGKILTVECATADGKSYTESGDIVDCYPSTGLFCNNFNNFPLICQDYMIRYQCEETVCQTPTARPTNISGETPTSKRIGDNGSTPTAASGLPGGQSGLFAPVTGQTPTAAPRGPCETQKRWSMWINRHTPEQLGGDSESLTAAELSRFCQRGIVDSIECQTIDGTDFKMAGDIMSCDVQKGLVCGELENYPIGCQNYRVRYQCTEEICQNVRQ